MQEYHILLAQLENESRTEKQSLHQMWYCLSPTLELFQILDSLFDDLNGNEAATNSNIPLMGGALLDFLTDKIKLSAGFIGLIQKCESEGTL
jgi:hypothetical protein